MTDDRSVLEAPVPPAITRRLEQVLKPIDAAGLTVACAESCTGGLVAAAISDVEGLGHVLDGALVTYSNEAKKRLLGIPADLIEDPGPVSEVVAIRMAEGALTRSAADIALSVTGFAGPAGPDDEEGLVHFAMARTDRDTVHREGHFGEIGRSRVRLACLEVMIDLLEEAGADA
ncbi:MAG TPA: CinA family protein [Brevundimonas sp.]|jgi:nicotinamide-nucleotide amidase